MEKIKVFGGLTIMIGALAASTFAGDFADLRFIGFSQDGKYMAFEQVGEFDVSDGEGGDYAKTIYLDVEKDTYALAPSAFEWLPGRMNRNLRRANLDRYNAKVAVSLKKLRIIRGNTGRQVVAHLLYDWSFIDPIQSPDYVEDANSVSTDRTMPDYKAGIIRRGAASETVTFNPDFFVPRYTASMFYVMTLTSTELPRGKPCFEGLGFELTLMDQSHHKDMPIQTLHKDGERVPESRSCPYGYHIEQVYFYKNRLAVFINTFTQGFGGTDMRYIAVTGKLAANSVGPHSLSANEMHAPSN